MLKMAVLLSGSGRTLDNFHRCIEQGSLAAQIEVVISNVEGVPGVKKAERYGYPVHVAPNSEQTNAILAGYDVDIICLAGYLKLYLPPEKLKRRVINIHPSLIPSFCGKNYYGHHVHEAVKRRGCTVSGCTVHFANEEYDQGPIVLQKTVQLDYEDSVEEIGSKVFELECETYPEAINLVDEKGIDFFWKRGEKNNE